MKKIYKLSIFLVALTLASSCAQDEGVFDPPIAEPEQDESSTGAEDPETDSGDSTSHFRQVVLTAGTVETKTVLGGQDESDAKIAVLWEYEDEMTVMFSHPDNGVSKVSFKTSLETPSSCADFIGIVSEDILAADSGYESEVYAVYPPSAVAEDGTIAFALPVEQTVAENGSFASSLNLSSARLTLDAMRGGENPSATFRNAMSVLRLPLEDDVASVTLSGTSFLAGTAPLAFDDDGRLMIVEDGEWVDGSASVTLLPAGGDCFQKGTATLLVWPGEHTSLTATLKFKEYGDYTKHSKSGVTFKPSTYYTLNFNADSEILVSELVSTLDGMDGDLSDLEAWLDEWEDDPDYLSILLSRIQSVVLMSEYLGNEVYASYSELTYSRLKHDVELNYIVRPASVARRLVDDFASSMSALVRYRTSSGDNVYATLPVNAVELNGDVLTVSVDADGLDNEFYAGRQDAELALQISDGNSNLISDFARLVPKLGSALNVNFGADVPVIQGASVLIPFSYALLAGETKTLSCSATNCTASITDNNGTGYLVVAISNDHAVSEQSATLTFETTSETIVKNFSFMEGGIFDITSNGALDYIGGEVSLTVTSSFSNWYSEIKTGSSWLTSSGSTSSGFIYSAAENTGSSRTARVDFTVTDMGLKYVKSFDVVQSAYGTSLIRTYYSDGQHKMLNTASGVTNALNIVIFGDGYQKKDLAVGGKFERSAQSAMDSFFGVEPFRSFKNCFNVYMVAYTSTDEGIDMTETSPAVDVNTYFGANMKSSGNTYAYCDADKVTSAVRSLGGLSSDAQYYRTIAIVLVNTSENVGSCGYPVRESGSFTSTTGEPYRSFAISVLAANSIGTNGLVKHEAGGHAFGRLADEYYTGGAAGSDVASSLANWHDKGWYLNVCTSTDYWSAFTSAGYTSDEVGYVQGGFGYASGVYRSTAGGIMQDNNGVFNAVSRHAIYQRIIRQTQGYDAYNWTSFLEYDRQNH